MTISKAAMDLLEARERLQSLKDEHATLSRRAKVLEAESSAVDKRLRELAGTYYDRSYCKISSAESDVKNAEERLRRESLPLAVWKEQPKYGDRDVVVTRATPKRIYVGAVDGTREDYYDITTGMRSCGSSYGVLDVPATLASIEQHAAANQPSLKGK